jgi:hypothetical protein
MLGGAVMMLDERLQQELKDLYTKLNNEGKLLSKAQLEGYYETFRKRFGPDHMRIFLRGIAPSLATAA